MTSPIRKHPYTKCSTIEKYFSLSCFFILFYFQSFLKGEGLNNLKNVEGADTESSLVPEQSTISSHDQQNATTGGGEIGFLDVEKPRPASATPGDNISTTSSLTTTSANEFPVPDQSPARSPHARSWTVPGVLEYFDQKIHLFTTIAITTSNHNQA